MPVSYPIKVYNGHICSYETLKPSNFWYNDTLKFVKNVRNGIGYKIRYERDRFKKRFERLKQLCNKLPLPANDIGSVLRPTS